MDFSTYTDAKLDTKDFSKSSWDSKLDKSIVDCYDKLMEDREQRTYETSKLSEEGVQNKFDEINGDDSEINDCGQEATICEETNDTSDSKTLNDTNENFEDNHIELDDNGKPYRDKNG